MSYRSAAPRLLCILFLAGVPIHAQAAGAKSERAWYSGKLDLETGFDYRQGDYGGRDDTAILAVPLSARYRFQALPWSSRDEIHTRVSVPYLYVSGPERGSASPGSSGTDTGIGDVSVRSTYVFRPRPLWIPDVYVSERIKIPTANERKNLGTGEFDFTTDLGLRKRIPIRESSPFRHVQPWVRVGYKVVGEPPGKTRDNSWRAGAGATLRIIDSFDLGAGYSFRESTIPGRGDSEVVTLFTSFPVARWLRLSPYATYGLSTRSQDWGSGLVIRLTQRVE